MQSLGIQLQGAPPNVTEEQQGLFRANSYPLSDSTKLEKFELYLVKVEQ